MPKYMHELSKELRKAKLTEYQIDSITKIVVEYLELNQRLQENRLTVCPKCGQSDKKFLKTGKIPNGKQRYLCTACNKKFVYNCQTITYYSRQSSDRWITLIHDTLALVPALTTAATLNITERSVLNMRYKFMCALEDIIQEQHGLDGIIESDDTFVLESYKGSKVTHRKARKRKGPASKRGLSYEQICIMVASSRSGREQALVIGRGKPNENSVTQSLKSHVKQLSTLITDGSASFNQLVSQTACKHYIVKSHKEYNEFIHLNNVNSFHSMLARMLSAYRGVATKHLNRYCALLVFMRLMADLDPYEKIHFLISKLQSRFHYHSIYECKTNLCTLV